MSANLFTSAWVDTSDGLSNILTCLERPHTITLQNNGIPFVATVRLLLTLCYHNEETSSSLLRRGVSKKTLRCVLASASYGDVRSSPWSCDDLQCGVAPLQRLTFGVPTGNNRVFATHARDDQPLNQSDEQLVVDYLCYQLAALDFGRSGTGVRHHSPCATAAMAVAIGDTLLETLALNLVPERAPPRPSWTLNAPSHADFEAQTRALPESLCERYTWIAQAIRFVPQGIMTGRGFKLSALSDPMSASYVYQKRLSLPRKAFQSPWLTACALSGFLTEPAETVRYAAAMGRQHRLRVVAQLNNPDASAVWIETFDEAYETVSLDPALAAEAQTIFRQFEQQGFPDAGQVFLSEIEMGLHTCDRPDLAGALGRALEDTGLTRLERLFSKRLVGA